MGKFIDTGNRMMVSRCREKKEMRHYCSLEFLFGMMKNFRKGIVVMVRLWIWFMPLNFTLKMVKAVSFMWCIFNLFFFFNFLMIEAYSDSTDMSPVVETDTSIPFPSQGPVTYTRLHSHRGGRWSPSSHERNVVWLCFVCSLFSSC